MSQRHTFGLAAVTCVVLVAATTLSHAQLPGLLQNGSFESGFTSWTATGHLTLAQGDPSHPASEGANAVVFNAGNSTPTGIVTQTFATSPGQRYGLTFDLGTVGAISDQRMRVTVEGTGVLVDQTIVFAGIHSGPFYIPQHISFVANSTSTKASFSDASFSYDIIDTLFDNVRVVEENAQVPLITQQPQRKATAQDGSATFIVGASGTGPLTYQWHFNGVPIPGASTSAYTVTGATAAKAGNYSAVVGNAAGSVSTSAATLTVLPSALLLNGSFEYGAAGWTLNNDNVATTLNTNYAFTDGTQLMHFNFGQRPANGIISQSFATSVGVQYQLAFDMGAFSFVNQNEQRMRLTLQGGGPVPLLEQNLSVFAPGNGTRYLPQTFNFVANSTMTTVIFQDTSTSTVNVDLVLDHVRVTLQGAPVITAQPQSLTVSAGSSASFSVTATGQGTLAYQWRFNGANISGATASTYTIANAQASHAGSYTVVVSNASGPTTSAAATLTVVTGGGLTNGSFEADYAGWTVSGNQSVVSGAPFTATNGAKAVAFNVGQKTPNGVLSQSFTTTAGQTYTVAFDAGAFSQVNTSQQRMQVRVQGNALLLSQTITVAAPGNGTRWAPQSLTFLADSAAVTLTFQDTSLTSSSVDLMLDHVRVTLQGAPVITAQPQSLTVSAGSSASFSVTATGPGTLAYQWRFNGANISGATASTYTIANAQASHAGSYTVVVSNAGGPTTSAAATLTVQSAPVITAQPQSVTVSAGSSASFSVSATGPGTLAYQWRFNGANISGATASTYTIANAQASHAGSYTVVVSNASGPTTSAAATLTVVTGGGFTNGSFEADYAGWTVSGNQSVVSGAPFTATNGAKAVAFNVGQKTPNGVLSQSFTTTVGQTYTVAFDAGAFSQVNTSQQRMQVRVQGSMLLLSQTVTVAAPGNGTRWVPQSLTFLADSAAVTLTFQDTSLTSSNVDLMLDHVRVTLQGAPVITAQPQSVTVSAGSSASFSVSATGPGTLAYQWRFNGANISGATASTYTIANAQASHAGSYTVVVSNAGGPTTSAAATLTVQSAPVITAQPQSVTVSAGSSASFSVSATGPGTLAYQWRFNGANISGATASTYTIANAQASHAGSYTVVVSNASGPTTSAAATLTVVTGGGFTNGSFEADYAGWTVSGNQSVVSGAPFTATNGAKAVAFNVGQKTPNGVLSQSFTTTVGQTYTLAFDAGAFSQVNTSQQRMQVRVQGNALLLSQTITVAAPGNGTRWAPQSLTFLADSAAVTLTFQDTSLTSSSVDLMLDHVRVTQSGPSGQLANGSFENDYSGWTAIGHQVIASNDPSHPATDGVKAVVFNANDLIGTGVLSQVFATVPGQRYGLAFDLGTVGGIADQLMRVIIEGVGVVKDETLIVSAPTTAAFYVPHHISFVANSTETTLTFADDSYTYVNIDLLLDNVSSVAEDDQAPLVISQPMRKSVVQGGSVTFNVQVSGPGPFTYEWQFAGGNIPGATSSSYTVTGANASKAGNYSVVVTNAAGSISSSAATLTVIPPGIVLNGSFEYGVAAWTFTGNVSISTNPNYGVTDGTQLVHFNWGQQPPNGVLSQTIATTPGQTYTLAFDVGAFSTLNTNEQRMQVTVQGSTLLQSRNISVNAPGNGGAYMPQVVTFVANSSATVLSFRDISTTTTNVDLLLDNVRVTSP